MVHPRARAADACSPPLSTRASVSPRSLSAVSKGGGRIRSIADGVERLGPGAVEAILRSAPTYDIFNGDGRLALAPDRFRLHALCVQRAADRVAELSGIGDRDELALAAILHDIGQPVLARMSATRITAAMPSVWRV
jgi:HD-like signal output (HDOD) protein